MEETKAQQITCRVKIFNQAAQLWLVPPMSPSLGLGPGSTKLVIQ